MSLLDTASLIVTPNGYKEGKLYSVIPSDGSGDLSVTRATTATRVNSVGLVELVPYNLFTYSEQFDNADWSKSSGTITANSTTAPDGTTTADTFTGNGALSNHDFFEGVTGGANTTASIYVKKNTAQFVYISLNYQSSGVNWATGVYDLDNLTTATFQSGGVINQVATITDEGNGWRRITLSVATANTSLYCMYGLSDSMSPTLGSRGRVENSSAQSFYAWGAQLVEGSTAKDYQKTETRLNIPRLDYSNGTCPSLLVEPQRTNLALYSEDIAQSIPTFGGGSITANNTIAPSGILNADKFTIDTSNSVHYFYKQYASVNGQSYTSSIFLKAGTGRYFLYRIITNGTAWRFGVTIDLETGTILSQNSVGTPTGTSSKIEDYGNGWYRVSLSINSLGSVIATLLETSNTATPSFDANIDYSYTGNGTDSYYIWGNQVEAGSYATSYIPTTSASVTRNADVISKTSFASAANAKTWFADADLTYLQIDGSNSSMVLTIRSGSYEGYFRYFVNNDLSFQYSNPTSPVNIVLNNAIPVNTTKRLKMAARLENNNFAFYVNGVLIGTNVVSTRATGLDILEIGNYANIAQYQLSGGINAIALWDEALTNTQLAQLTTI